MTANSEANQRRPPRHPVEQLVGATIYLPEFD